MKISNLFITSLLALVVALVPSLSFAELSPYVGGDVQWKTLAAKGFQKHLFAKDGIGYNVYGGVNFAPCMGLEFGSHVASKSKNGAKTKLRGLHVSLVSKYAVSDSVPLNLVGSLGLSRVHFKQNHHGFMFDSKALQPKLGLGFEYAMFQNVSWRTMAGWEGGFNRSALGVKQKPSISLSTGLNLHF